MSVRPRTCMAMENRKEHEILYYLFGALMVVIAVGVIAFLSA